MKIDPSAAKQTLKGFDFPTLFREQLGWDNHAATLTVPLGDSEAKLTAVAQKRGFVAWMCPAIPDRQARLKIDQHVTKTSREHFIIYADRHAGKQIWQWVRREPGKPLASREHHLDVAQSGDALVQRLEQIAIDLAEEEAVTVVDVAGRARAAFDVDKVTKRFYDRFKAEHSAFLKLVTGITGAGGKEWYTSLMLNRLMFVYFIQKKGFLDGDTDYLRNRLRAIQKARGKDKFQSFYRYFLVRLFHDGLGKPPADRKLDASLAKILGQVPYLNGGFFEVHQLEETNPDTDIPDKAFERLFDFFDQYSWHLDERPLRADNEINPDVVGYIFEKYINQKEMGAYYTKEDITEYISANTILPFLFDAAQANCAVAFKAGSALWRLLQDSPERYIYSAMRHGVLDSDGREVPMPPVVAESLASPGTRDMWNRSADPEYGLPAETWREYLTRRQRCLAVRDTLASGRICQIADVVTLNLNIWQLSRDVILNAEGPELVRAFWHAAQTVTVLDPTCGSGAFLFASLRILDTIYSDCLERMSQFVGDATERDRHREHYQDFRAVLDRTAQHPNQRYFILKSIIINNLFGVDLMEEAVEICKLRLFLKLVAQIDTAHEIEPLPDIDFNVRSGNTLVGFVSLNDVTRAQAGKLNFAKDEIEQIESEAKDVEKAFQSFRISQTTRGGRGLAVEKQALRRKLFALDDELDRYLAGEYAVDPDKPKEFAAWRQSHEPFHWLVEFYGIMSRGGFDVIVGNPPYVEYGKVKSTYSLRHYRTLSCGNLYAYVWERALALVSPRGKIGMIQPVAAVCTDGYEPLQLALREAGSQVVSNFNDRPSKLFDGLEHIRLCIIIHSKGDERNVFSTTYNKWQAIERPQLFQRLVFADTTALNVNGITAKIGNPMEVSILGKLRSERGMLGEYERDGKWKIYYTRKLSHFVQILDFVPSIRDAAGRKREPSELKEICFDKEEHRDVFLAILNSSLFFWLLTVYSDCRNLNRRDIGFARFDFDRATQGTVQQLAKLSKSLMKDIKANARVLTMRYKDRGELQIQCTYPKYSKGIVDQIDQVLGRHLGFTDQEVDFIVNFDIKYRMGGVEDDDETGG
jgi:hypothetical protein